MVRTVARATFSAVPADPPGDVVLAPINGEPHTLREWLTTFHLVVVVLDPYTYESAWLIDTAGRILRVFEEADCRVAWLCTCPADDARKFLGPWAEEILTFADPDRAFVKAVELERLPALVHIAQDGTVAGAAEGWDPAEWRAAADNLARVMSWRAPLIPAPGDPVAFPGTPAAG
jgi:hypothetical protein